MNYGNIKPYSIENGTGVRVSLFVSGCTHHCKNCFNPETWDFSYGKEFTRETEEEIIKNLQPGYIKGLTLLGGDPLEPENQIALLSLLKEIKETMPEKDIWAYTGYVWEDFSKGKSGYTDITPEFLKCIDILVDGPFIEEKKNLMLPFRGSENQRIIDVQVSINQGKVILAKENS